MQMYVKQVVDQDRWWGGMDRYYYSLSDGYKRTFFLATECSICGDEITCQLMDGQAFTERDVASLKSQIVDHEDRCRRKQEVTITVTRAERETLRELVNDRLNSTRPGFYPERDQLCDIHAKLGEDE